MLEERRIEPAGIVIEVVQSNHWATETLKTASPLFSLRYSNELQIWGPRDDVPEKIIPIMGTGGASVIAFDYRLSNRNPKVVFVNADKEGEDAITEISANFTDFLSLLKSAQHSYIWQW